ncbi:MAG: hypothetical protein U0452_04420 [Anaerolineae bacterium]
MNAQVPVFRITIKELVLEIEDEQAVQQIGRSLGALLGQFGVADEEFVLTTDSEPKRRGRKPKSVAAEKGGRKRRRARSDAATAQIRKLRGEGFFIEPRRASEVKSALAERGYKLENRQVYATLKYMADANDLLRSAQGEDGVFLYSAASV